MYFSIIIPVYNRPAELDELLQSISEQSGTPQFEVLLIEDGSTITSKHIFEKYKEILQVKYFFKENSGPGDSRNFGMYKAKGDYFIILDSDCILPNNYLRVVQEALQQNYTDAFGGPDTAHASFSPTQKAINYSMTSFLTTGGLRGNDKSKDKFQLRSFNMGISKKAFIQTQGFSKQYYGEDIDLTFQLWKNNWSTQFIKEAFVYHKRRTTWSQFFKQTFNFGAARPILNRSHVNTAKITFWFPSIFIMGLAISLLLFLLGFDLLFILYGCYFGALFFDAIQKNKCYEDTCFTSIQIGFYAIIATLVQFFGYGLGFIRSMFRLKVMRKTEVLAFPRMFERKSKF